MKFNKEKRDFSLFNEEQIQRIIYSLWDFQQALSALTFLLEECDFKKKYAKVQLRKFRCYETNMIVSLARPFTKARGKSILSLKKLGIYLESKEKILLERVIGIRNEIVAHSDNREMYFKFQTMEPFDDSKIKMPIAVFYEGLHFEGEEFDQLELLLHDLIHGVSRFIFDWANKHPSKIEMFVLPDRLNGEK